MLPADHLRSVRRAVNLTALVNDVELTRALQCAAERDMCMFTEMTIERWSVGYDPATRKTIVQLVCTWAQSIAPAPRHTVHIVYTGAGKPEILYVEKP